MLLDTSGLLCLLHRAEPFHQKAGESYRASSVRLTHNYVLAELVALATARGFPRDTVLEFLFDLLDNPDVETVWVEEATTLEALDLLARRLDKTYSLCDAVSFVLMRRRNVHDALTTDRHFEQEGFRRLLI